MPTTREVDAAKTERLRREARHYTSDLLGRPCPVCRTALPLALIHAGENNHPCCDPTFEPLIAAARAAQPPVAPKETP